MLCFSYDNLTAITFTNGVELWYPEAEGRLRLFKHSRGGKAVLRSDNGAWWSEHKKDAPFCEYAQYWMGKFPWSSWCFAIRICKLTGQVDVQTIETSINCRGLSDSERWERECLSYTPKEQELYATLK